MQCIIFNQTMKSLPFIYSYSTSSGLFLLYKYKMFIMKLKNSTRKKFQIIMPKKFYHYITLGYPLYLFLCKCIYINTCELIGGGYLFIKISSYIS